MKSIHAMLMRSQLLVAVSWTCRPSLNARWAPPKTGPLRRALCRKTLQRWPKQKKRIKDTLKTCLKRCSIDPNAWKDPASDRSVWQNPLWRHGIWTGTCHSFFRGGNYAKRGHASHHDLDNSYTRVQRLRISPKDSPCMKSCSSSLVKEKNEP